MLTVYTIWLREMTRFMRAKSRIVSNLAMPVIWLIVLGIGIGSSFDLAGFNFQYIEFLAPGIIGMTLLFTSIFSGISVIYDKQFGFLKEILVAPVSRISIVLGKISGSGTVALINGVLILIIAVALGAIPLAGLSILGIIMSMLFMILISSSFISIGLIIASKLNDMEGFQMIMSFFVMPIFFLSGAFFPIENIPVWLKVLAFADPLMYGVDGLRGSLIGVSMLPIWMSFTVLLAFTVVVILIAAYMFRKITV
jgi:ABC-2 type transport system permease protein